MYEQHGRYHNIGVFDFRKNERLTVYPQIRYYRIEQTYGDSTLHMRHNDRKYLTKSAAAVHFTRFEQTFGNGLHRARKYNEVTVRLPPHRSYEHYHPTQKVVFPRRAAHPSDRFTEYGVYKSRFGSRKHISENDAEYGNRHYARHIDYRAEYLVSGRVQIDDVGKRDLHDGHDGHQHKVECKQRQERLPKHYRYGVIGIEYGDKITEADKSVGIRCVRIVSHERDNDTCNNWDDRKEQEYDNIGRDQHIAEPRFPRSCFCTLLSYSFIHCYDHSFLRKAQNGLKRKVRFAGNLFFCCFVV